MRPAFSVWLPRAAVALVVGAGALVAWWAGGGADGRLDPPHAEGARARTVPDAGAPATSARGGEAFEVQTRLADAIESAQIDVPVLAAANVAFRSYWRKMPGPWSRPRGAGGRAARDDRLAPDERAGGAVDGAHEVRRRVGAAGARVEHERRELRAARGRLRPHAGEHHVPPGAAGRTPRLRVAPALVAAPFSATTLFEVVVVDAGGAAHVVSETRVPAGDTPEAHRWHDVDVDLSPWGDQDGRPPARHVDRPAWAAGAGQALAATRGPPKG